MDATNSREEEGVYLNDQRRYLDFAAVRKILGEDEAASYLIEDLIDKAVLYRGYIFQCEICRNSAWYAIEDVGQQFTCTRCRRTQTYHRTHWKKPLEPKWYYKLDEIVYQGYSHNYHVPILALSCLEESSQRSFLYAPEIEIRLPGQKPVELDICCCVDGGVIIGEAKITDVLADTDRKERTLLSKYAEIANRVGAKSIVISTFSDAWQSRTMENARNILGEKRARFMGKAELLATK